VQPLRVDLDIVVHENQQVSACLLYTSVERKRLALPRFKYVAESAGKLPAKPLNHFSGLIF